MHGVKDSGVGLITGDSVPHSTHILNALTCVGR